MLFNPMRLLRIPEPFDHPDRIFEPKLDGFRALAHVKGHHCTLISRNGHTFKSWPQLSDEIAHSVRADSAILDGEICRLNPDGTSNFQGPLMQAGVAVLRRLRRARGGRGENIASLPLHAQTR